MDLGLQNMTINFISGLYSGLPHQTMSFRLQIKRSMLGTSFKQGEISYKLKLFSLHHRHSNYFLITQIKEMGSVLFPILLYPLKVVSWGNKLYNEGK